jgi:tetratricopeptide (TPR) repeat protein
MRFVWALSVVLLSWSAALARAQADDADAQTHADAGSASFAAGDYAAAAGEFQSAYELSHRPELLYNLYVAHERQGHAAEAADYLRAYLGSAQEIENRSALEAQLVSLQQRIPSPAPAAVPRPEPEPAASEARASRPVDEPREVSERFVQAVALFGVAGTGALTFAVAGSLALAKDRDLATSCGRDRGRTCSDAQVRGLRTRETVADVGLGLLGVGVLIGVTLLWLDHRESARRVALRPAASIDAHGGSIALGGRF